MKWCEHIGGESITNLTCADYKAAMSCWHFCPICGVKRPEEPKTLSERIEESLDSYPPQLNKLRADKIVSLVREFALESYDEWMRQCLPTSHTLFSDEIKSWR